MLRASDGCANKRLESVFIQWDGGLGPQSRAPKHLSKFTKTDVPPPKVEILAWTTRAFQQVAQCEMYSVVNKKQWKQMAVYKWAVEYDLLYDRGTTHVFQCRVENI
ncbi:hypothetical protein AAVH_12823 [Aphelenchoides avenae]|nr:hypothetical protein AAVH_12823 [Aphelenchus avenae]